MKLDFDSLKEICETPGISGHEGRIRKLVISKLQGIVDEWRTDHLGNLIAIKRGIAENPKKLMFAAHLDEIGFIVTHIDDNGFLKFHPIGGFDPKTLTSMRVMVHGKEDLPGTMGSKPIHIMSADERGKAPAIDSYYIDLGLDKDVVKEKVEIGSPVTRRQQMEQMGDCINGKSLDNRLSVYILLEVLKKVGHHEDDIYAVFTVQEEVGIRGAQVAAHQIDPDYGIAIDVTIANDTPGSQPHQWVTQLGKGAAIKLYDSSTICDPRMVQFLKNIAKENNVPWQVEILTGGGTDTAGIQRMGKRGAIAGAVSIPLRYVHQTTETAHEADVLACIELLTAAAEQTGNTDWSTS